MFPNIPNDIINREIGRNRADLPSTIDSLLLISADYNISATNQEVNKEAEIEKDKFSDLLNSNDSNDFPVNFSKKEFDSFDSTTRQRILKNRKAAMILEGRKKYQDLQSQPK